MPFSEPDRLKALPPYLFVDIDRRRRAAVRAGKDVINLGIGDPDQPTPAFIVDRMAEAIRDPATHHYPPDRGTREFREAAASFLRRRYGVEVDPEHELLTLIGTKEGLGHLPWATVNAGRTVLVPDPAYPVYRAATIFAGGRPWAMRLTEACGWLPDLETIPAEVTRDAVLMFLNYPNNPTGAVATREFFGRAIDFARRYDLIVAHDAAYADVYLSDEKPPSILEIPGAKEVAVEFHSLSKTFNMTGWRLGFVAGHAGVIAALARIKSNVDSGQFTAIQQAGVAAYEGGTRPEMERTRALYRQRAAILCDALREAGFRVAPPKATFYVWAGVPSGYDSRRAAEKLLDEAGVVCVPGVGFGDAGQGYVRFALTVDADRIREAVQRLRGLSW
jgi:LL-diaminopimelate aminotransferase